MFLKTCSHAQTDCSFHAVGRFRQSPPRLPPGEPQCGRLVPSRCDGRFVRAEHFFRFSGVSSNFEMSCFFRDPSSSHPVGSRHHSFNSFLSFLMDCVVMKLRSPKLLNRRFASDESPASVHTTNLDNSKSRMICSSRGFREACSFWLPGLMQNARGMPDLSMNNPIWTIGLGRCSLLGPYCFRPDSCSNSKK